MTMLRAERPSGNAEAPEPLRFFSLSIPALSGALIRYEGEDGLWTSEPLREGVFRRENICLETEEGFFFFSLPQAYEDLGRSTVRCLDGSEGLLMIEAPEEGGFRVDMLGLCPAEGFCDALVLRMRGERPDFQGENSITVWDRYTREGTSRWLFDGYHRFAPEAYEPTCEDGYYFCPAGFITDLMAKQIGSCPAARYLALASWDTMLSRQSGEGFWKTEPRSLWLYGSYGIEEGFYDTRFNTDLMETGLVIYEKLGYLPGVEAVRRYADFYKAYAGDEHTETVSGGWLVADYGGTGTHAPVHTSLNHQAAECRCLYGLAELLEDPELGELADRLLSAILDTGAGWIKPDHDLYYSVSAAGEFSGRDYLTLTFEDLTGLKELLLSKGRPIDSRLQLLIDEKEFWLIENELKDR